MTMTDDRGKISNSQNPNPKPQRGNNNGNGTRHNGHET